MLHVLALACGVLLSGVAQAQEAAPGPPPDAVEQWRAAHPKVRLGIDPSWAPFSFVDKSGKVHGADIELLDLVSKRIGIEFELVTTSSWSESYKMAKDGQIDVLLSTAMSPERKKWLNFTEPYLSVPVGIITRTDGPFYTSLDQIGGLRVAAARGYVTTEHIRKKYPQIILVETDNIEEALVDVSRKRADAVVTNMANACYFIRNRGLANLKISGVVDEPFELRLAVRKDWPELVTLLNQGIAAVPVEQQQQIFQKWIYVDNEEMVRWAKRWRWILAAAAVAAVAAAAGWWVVMRLRQEIARRRVVEEELRQVSRDKTELMGMAVHDLKNPVGILMANVEMMRDIDSARPDLIRETCGRMIPVLDRISRMLNNLLHIDALEHGQRPLQPRRVPLNEAVLRVIESCRLHALKKRIAIDFKGAPENPGILADMDALHEVIENLVSNALKFSHPETRIEIRTEASGEKVRLVVRDEGQGIPSDELPRIWEKFTHLSVRPTGDEGSSGLGLAITRSLVETMKGRIGCESEPGKGTSFTVEWPRV
jgi:signal transduction histidine kinase